MKLFKKITALILTFVMMFSVSAVVSAAEKATSLKITVAEINWPVGKSSSFAPVVTPSGASKSFAWSSSNPKVATISQTGKLTAVGAGTTTITCKTKDGSNLSTTCKVNVYPKTTSVNITVDTINWPVGKSSSFAPVIKPSGAYKSLTWTSSNPDVATISQTGKLTAVGTGTAKITCKTKDGTNLSDFCTVIVSGGAVKTESVNITVDTINWPVGKSSTFAPVIKPAGASTRLEWTSSDEKVATISQTGRLTAVGTGTATITCKTTDGTNLSDSCKINVSGIKVNKLQITVSVINWNAGKSSKFAPVIEPSNASNKTLLWKTSDESVATITQDGRLTAVSEGTAIISCETTDGSNLKASCTVNVKGSLT
ncbi:MAG: Ig domain-containing protein, partial [Clostridia bacterium]|nr:Ig domain-containing protein [Clostridia bacterium]